MTELRGMEPRINPHNVKPLKDMDDICVLFFGLRASYISYAKKMVAKGRFYTGNSLFPQISNACQPRYLLLFIKCWGESWRIQSSWLVAMGNSGEMGAAGGSHGFPLPVCLLGASTRT